MEPTRSHSKASSKQKNSTEFLFDDIDVSDKKKKQPSIGDYYRAIAARDQNTPIQYQPGLSNYSKIELGDDRIVYKKSVSQETYRIDTSLADKISLQGSDATAKTQKERKRDYEEAMDLMGNNRLLAMEQILRDKVQQRTQGGPYQLRNTFKFFDRDGSGVIDFPEFQRATDLMGLQFSEMQQLALFARYDTKYVGGVDYNNFVEKVMASDFDAISNSAYGHRLNNMMSLAFSGPVGQGTNKNLCDENDEDSDMDDDERETFLRTEVQKLFNVIDKDHSGEIDRGEVQALLKVLNQIADANSIDKLFDNVDLDGSGKIDFNEFYEWYKTN